MADKTQEYYLKLHYRVEFEFDPDEKSWVVRYPELPGCVAHGSTIAKALKRGEEFKAEWIKTALEVGDSIAEPEQIEYSGKLLVRFSRRTHARVAAESAVENISINNYIAQAVAEKLERTGMKELLARVYSYFESAQATTITITRKTPGGETTIGNLLETPSRKPTNSHA